MYVVSKLNELIDVVQHLTHGVPFKGFNVFVCFHKMERYDPYLSV